MTEDGYGVFSHRVHQLIGLDLSSYKDRQMKRRLSTFMMRLGVDNYFELADKIGKDKDALEKFKKFLTINVTEFFRNPEQFKILEEKVLPTLIENLKPGQPLRIWSAGCSDGSEPYTVVIILEEMGVKNYQIIATDLDTEILEKAKLGIYRQESLKNVAPGFLAKYFISGNDGLLQFEPKYAQKVKFSRQDLLKDRYDKDLDLIICRNVVIYFTEEAKNQVFRRMTESLKEDGVLFVGGTESILSPKNLGLKTVFPFFYKKSGDSEAAVL